jgi:hypothetical protein
MIYSFIMIFDKLNKDSIINLRFRDIRNTLLDRELKGRLKNKILKSKEQKLISKQSK